VRRPLWLDDRVFNGLSGLRDARDFPGFKGLSGFKKFLLRGNVVDLAVAVVVGTAFAAVVTSFGDSFLTPLIGLVSGGGDFGGVLVVNEQRFTYGAFLSQVLTFVLTAAVVYFVVVLPLHRLLERRAKGEEPGPVGPTELELLTEIRDLLRAQQGLGPVRDAPAPAGPDIP
jgi:large conductance mechanosensitive channel